MSSHGPRETPPFARTMHDRLARLGLLEASSATTVKGEVIAWAVALQRPGHVLVAAVGKREPGAIVAMRVAAEEPAAMAMARSLVRRNAKRIADGGLCAAHFLDLEDVPFGVCAPQFVVSPASGWGLDLPGIALAVGCTWQEMSLDPEAREAAVRARTPEGLTGDVLSPTPRALEGMFRSLRRAKEPLSRNAALTIQALVADHGALVRERLAELVLVPNLSDERAELIGALVDTINPQILAAVPREAGRRVVVSRLRLPEEAGGKVVAAYFFDATHAGLSQLDARHPEAPLAAGVTQTGFALLDGVFEKHQPTIQEALGVAGELRLQRGFHADASLEEVRSSFASDGFVPVSLVLDA